MQEKHEHIQLVISSLKPGASYERFVELTKEMYEWLQLQNGFVSYEVYENHPKWADKLVYENIECAERINQDFLTTEIAKEMLDMVEPAYKIFTGKSLSL
ncbi:MAG: hypothetical protein OEZ47_17445 [Gammaproteobacteria bacterium]|nr:hypothetical protein [Gammaproteobacteria bacterium]